VARGIALEMTLEIHPPVQDAHDDYSAWRHPIKQHVRTD
jgi:hypothetical protein